MKSWKLSDLGRPIELVDTPRPEVRGGGVVIDVLAAHLPAYTQNLSNGVRGSVPTPLTLGVSAIGRVVEVADDVFNVGPGDLVVDAALLDSGDVDASEEVIVGWTGIGGRGRATETTTAMRDLWRDGVYAEQALCAKETLVRIPGAEQMADLSSLAIIPWLTIAARGCERAEVSAGQSVVVLGGTGQLGAAAVTVALARGASRVVAVGRNRDMLARVEQVDARVSTVPLDGGRDEVAAAIVAAADGEVDVVIDALGPVPSADPTLAGFDALRPGGTIVLIGGVRQDLAFQYSEIMRRRLTIRGSWMAPPSTVMAVWRMVRSGLIDLGAFSITTVGMDDLSSALELASGASGLDFVVLVP